MKIILILCLLLASCATTKTDPFLYVNEINQSLTVQSEVQINSEESLQIQQQIDWARSKGLTGHVTVKLTEAGPTLDGSNRFIGGRVWNVNPIEIILPRSILSNLAHELFHVVMWQKTGNVDSDHRDPSWKEWGLF